MKPLSTVTMLVSTLVISAAVLNVPKVLPKAVTAEDYIEQCETIRNGTYQGITETGELVTIRNGRATFKRYNTSSHTALHN